MPHSHYQEPSVGSVRKPNSTPMWEGWQLITQAITEWCIEARGPRHPCSLPPASPPFSFCKQDKSPWGVRLPTAAEQLEVPRHCTMIEIRLYNVAGTAGKGSEIHGLPQPSPLHLCWTVGLRVTGVQWQLPHHYPQGLIDQGALGINTMANAAGNLEVTWKSIYLSSRMRTRRMLSPIKIGIGI